jgi:hypothetical protein
MASWFQCTNCEARYQFDASLAGRAIACRACGFVFRVPPVPVSTAPRPEAAPAPGGRWHLRFMSGRQFGPVLTEVIEEWVREGRADGESLVRAEGSDEWFHLADAFPDLIASERKAEALNACDPLPSPAAALPAAGLLCWLDDVRGMLGTAARNHHEAAEAALAREVQRTTGAVRLNAARSVLFGEARTFGGSSPREALQMRADNALVAEFAAHGGVFYAVFPWGRMGRLPHEYFSILPGGLPHAVALRRGCESAFGAGQWVGINGTEDDVVAMAARRSSEDLSSGIVWNWYSARREFTMVQVWGVQAVPLGSGKYLHAVQTSGRGPSGSGAGLLWYLERQSAFYRFARRLNVPDTHESHVLFGSCTGQILTDIADRRTAEAAGEKLLKCEDCFLPDPQAVHNVGPL